jgi:hypothetical protein
MKSPCNFQVTSKGCDWGNSVWGCRDASLHRWPDILKIGVAKRIHQLPEEKWSSANNSIRLGVFPQGGDALGQELIRTNQYPKYFPILLNYNLNVDFLNKQSMHKNH